MSMDIINDFVVPSIIDLEYYKTYKNIPLASNTVEQDATIEKVIKNATLDINITCGNRVFKRYNEMKTQAELSDTDKYNLYCLQQAICSLVEYYIDTGMRFVDRSTSTSGNLSVNLTSASSDAIWETKRQDIIKKLTDGKWYQTIIAQNPRCDFKPFKDFDFRRLILQLDTIYKRIDTNNNFMGYSLVDVGNIKANRLKQDKIMDYNLFNCLWNGKDISGIADYVINVSDNPEFDNDEFEITLTTDRIKDINGREIMLSDLGVGAGIFLYDSSKPCRWYFGGSVFKMYNTSGGFVPTDYYTKTETNALLTPITQKLNRALLTPLTTPIENELVGISDSNEQLRIKIGEGLEYNETTQTLKVDNTIQTKNDTNLQTTDKTVVGAINELNGITIFVPRVVNGIVSSTSTTGWSVTEKSTGATATFNLVQYSFQCSESDRTTNTYILTINMIIGGVFTIPLTTLNSGYINFQISKTSLLNKFATTIENNINSIYGTSFSNVSVIKSLGEGIDWSAGWGFESCISTLEPVSFALQGQKTNDITQVSGNNIHINLVWEIQLS